MALDNRQKTETFQIIKKEWGIADGGLLYDKTLYFQRGQGFHVEILMMILGNP